MCDINAWIEITTKIATCRFKFENNDSIRVTLHTGESVLLHESDKQMIYDNHIAWNISEPILKNLLKSWISTEKNAKNDSTLIEILDTYSKQALAKISPAKYVFKLWFSKAPDYIPRDSSGRIWINYHEQLSKGKFIHDVPYGCGLWTIPEDLFPAIMNFQSLNIYGNSILVLKTCWVNKYLVSGKNEIIGERFKYVFDGALNDETTWLKLKKYISDKFYSKIDIDSLKRSGHEDIAMAVAKAYKALSIINEGK